MLLDIESLDEDIVTSATPKELEKIFHDKKIDSVGKSFLVTIINGIDVATYRTDVYNDKNCEPVRAKTLYDDVSRRDLTINSLAYDPTTNELIDCFNGLNDLDNGIVKFVGNPTKRIKEDPVRMIRACRFVALLSNNDKIARFDTKSFSAIKENAHLIKDVPVERINKEIMKVMSTCDEPSIFFIKLYMLGLLDIILPELANCFFFTGGNHHKEYLHEHLLITCNSITRLKPVLRFIGLLHDIGKVEVYDSETHRFLRHEKASAIMALDIFKRLKFTTKEQNMCYGVVKLHMRNVEFNTKPKSIRKLMSKCIKYKISWMDLLVHNFADKKANINNNEWTKDEKNKFVQMFIDEKNREGLVLQRSDLCVDGKDMLELGFVGEEIKGIIEFLTKSCISNPKLNKRETLLKMTRGYVK